MNKKINKFVYWIPRILSTIFILFLMLFSFDIFEMNLGFWGTIVGLFMHNIPALVLLLILLISWKYEIVGGIGFMLGGIVYIALLLKAAISSGFEWSYLLLAAQISGIAFFIGIMFLIGWFQKKQKRLE